MKETIALVTMFVGLLAAAAIAAQREPNVMGLNELVEGAHLYGCQVREHGSDPASECLSLRRAILARAQTGALVARRHAFEDAAKVCQRSRNLKTCVEALERRAAD